MQVQWPGWRNSPLHPMTHNLPKAIQIRAGLPVCVILLFLSSVANALNHQVHDLDSIGNQPLGKISWYLEEPGQPLAFAETSRALEQNRFVQGRSDVLTFGIGKNPVWVFFAVNNDQASDQQRKLLVDTSWLDQVRVYIRHRDSGEIRSFEAGDTFEFSQRPVENRTFTFDVKFAAGISDIFIRVETPDPMVIPVYLLNEQDAKTFFQDNEFSYGIVYGYLLALLAYNMMLFFGLRDLRYLLYAVYLCTFIIANLSYTGHAFMWLWPESVIWQQWAQPLLMILYGFAGLIFALYFLDIKKYSFRVYRIIHSLMLAILIFFTFTFIFRFQGLALLTAFSFVSVFVVLMLVLGIYALARHNPIARYFLLAVSAGLLGAAISAACTWGFIPFNNWTFRAVEIGMVIEATLLALALTYQFRHTQRKQMLAERLARIDPLTELNNRRSFYEKASSVWSAAERHNRTFSIIIFDLDTFKFINDSYGHECGDRALIETGKALLSSVRRSDIPARWGGEEFIVLLPDSNIQDAMAFAGRLCEYIANMIIHYGNKTVRITASFGVAEKSAADTTIDNVITKADKALYSAKAKGKNQVAVWSEEAV
jgi:diguanylate cyclase (GGDEF)-like protein